MFHIMLAKVFFIELKRANKYAANYRLLLIISEHQLAGANLFLNEKLNNKG